MPPSTGLRARLRAELMLEIKQEARRHLAAQGAPGLSLRAVTRSLGMASSAIYRYFPSRDDLLTALIVDAYRRRRRGGRCRVPAWGLRGPVACRRTGHAGLGPDQSARIRPGLRVTGTRLPGPRGHHRPGEPGHPGAGRPGRRRRPRRNTGRTVQLARLATIGRGGSGRGPPAP
jgi:AcrR family transcriptional regulator